jgi:adenylosuccinate synthase
MASKKKKAVKAGSGAIAAGQAARNNEYVQRLIDDDSLRDDLRTAFESARKAYDRINGKGPQKALDDKKTQKELKEAATSLKSAADSLRGGRKKKRGGKGKFLLVGIVGAGLALGLSEGLRNKVLDALFGAEEEFEYTSSTTSNSASSSSSTEKVGA